jgi:hypothetical protein
MFFIQQRTAKVAGSTLDRNFYKRPIAGPSGMLRLISFIDV